MSWSIGIHKNTLLVTTDTVTKFKIMAEDRFADDHLYFYPEKESNMYRVDFNYDYMEHMDVLSDNWIHELIIGDTENFGEVVFMSAEGDNAGDIWGYRYNNGECTHLTGDIVIRETIY